MPAVMPENLSFAAAFFFLFSPLLPTPPTYWPTLVAYYPYDNDKKFLCPCHVRERLHILSMHTRGATNLAPKLTFAWASHSDGEKEIL